MPAPLARRHSPSQQLRSSSERGERPLHGARSRALGRPSVGTRLSSLPTDSRFEEGAARVLGVELSHLAGLALMKPLAEHVLGERRDEQLVVDGVVRAADELGAPSKTPARAVRKPVHPFSVTTPFTREMAIFEEQQLSNPSENLQADWCV